MLSLASAIVSAKNKIDDIGAWLVLLEAQFNDPSSTVLYLVRNTEDITWDSQTWTKFPFELDIARQGSDGSIQTLRARVPNVLRAVEGHINDADGAVGSTVIVRVIYSEDLSLDAVIEETFTVSKTVCTAQWADFELAPENIWVRQFPRDVYDRQICRWKAFKGTECGYGGATATCNRTLDACINMAGGSNVARFGGFPAIPGVGFDPDKTAVSEAE